MNTTVSPKPYYEQDGITIYHGDCRDVLPTLERVDHVITDPPYSEHVHARVMSGGQAIRAATGFDCDYARSVALGFDAVTPELRAAVSEGCAALAKRWVLIFSDVEGAAPWRTACVDAGLDYVRTGAWVKLNGAPQFTGDRPAPGFEAVTICHQPGKKAWNGGGKQGVWTHPIELNRGGDNPRLHTTQKPLPLMRELVTLFTDPGDLVLDPFMGSGTTLVAAQLEGRRAIGIELEERYCEIAAKRLRYGTKGAAKVAAGQLPMGVPA